MSRKTWYTKVTRREFMARVGAVGAGFAAASQVSFRRSRAEAAVDLRGSGSVIVQEQGGQFLIAQRAAHFEPFERETGIKVIANPASTTAKVRASIEAGAPAYDVVDLSGGRLRGWAKAGVLRRIDYKYFDPGLKGSFSPIPADEFGVPNYYYSTLLAYDPDKFGANPPKTWADFWDTQKFPGPRTLGSGAFGPALMTFEIALLADGVEPAKLYPLDLDRAFRSLDKIKKHILQYWTAGAQPVQLIADRRVTVASAFNGRIEGLRSQGGKIGYSWEQGILAYDYWIVPRGAKNVENAMKYLAFVSQPRQQARFAEFITYSPTVPSAFELIGSERLPLLPTTPELVRKQVLQNFDYWNAEAREGRTYEQVAIERWEKWIAS